MTSKKIALTPPMGWNSYDYYDTTVNEEQVRANARVMAERLKEWGWEYVVIDIQWYAKNAGSMRGRFQYIPFGYVEIDSWSRLQPDPERFPSSQGGKGFGPLAAYIHSLGLKFGIHIMQGIPRAAAHGHMKILGHNETADMVADPGSVCRWNPDMYGVRDCPGGQAYYDSIIGMYADWGVDFIKCDDICNTDNLVPHSDRAYSRSFEIEMISRAIEKTGRDIVLSLSPGPAVVDESWHYHAHANMWRITDDFWDDWELLKGMFRRCEQWQDHVGPGSYPDCDMLPLGRIGAGFGDERDTRFTKDEQKTMFTLWCLMGSPLMMGGELTKLDDWTMFLLTNWDVLDMLPCRPRQLYRNENSAAWTALEPDSGEKYVVLFNLSDEPSELSVSIHNIWPRALAGIDLWEGGRTDFADGLVRATVAPHGCAAYRVTSTPKPWREDMAE